MAMAYNKEKGKRETEFQNHVDIQRYIQIFSSGAI